MKKVIAWLLVLALTAAISIGATLAYLTDTDEDVNVMTLGKVKIDQLEYERIDDETADAEATVQEFHDNKPLYPAVTGNGFDYTPGDTYVDWEQIGKDGYTSEIWNPANINNELDKMVFVKNKGDYDAYVRSVFAFEAGKYTTLEEFQKMVHLNLNTTDYTWEWVETPVAIPNEDGSATTNYFVATATYNKVLAPGALTEISLSQIALDKTATNADVEAFGDTYQVLVKTQGIQADGFVDPTTALNEGFDMIDANNIPWETDVPTKGGTVYNALHYLNADISDTNISKNVKNVVFGLNQNYAEIVNTYEGALVDVEQDVPVYAYYVPNDTGYDVYLLADDKIYTPKNSTELFQGMTVLTSVDTANMNTGRTEIFSSFFKDCNALTTVIGIEKWDTSKATMMDQMFNNCFVLDNLDLKKWNVTNVTNMKNMFRYCYALKNFDASAWYLPNVGDMAQMFLNCKSLEELDINSWGLGNAWRLYATFGSCASLKTVNVADWDTTSITDMTGAFQFCDSLESIDVSKWDVSNVTSTGHMFRACTSLTELDVSNWDVSNVTSFTAMFQGNGSNAMDMKIKALDLSKWEPNSAVHMNHMFYGCAQLTEMDVSGWNMPNLYTTSHMFADCINLETIDVSGWKTGETWFSMDGMFNDCRKVQTLDVSSFNTSGVSEFSQIFEACYALENIIGLDQWNTAKGNVFDEMFSGASSLKEVDLSSFDTSSARYNNVLLNGEKNYHGYGSMFNGTKSLQKLILGEKFVFSGDGSIPPANYPKFPNPAAKQGYTGKWKNVDTGVAYLASEIPEKTAATYVPHYEYAPSGETIYNAVNFLNANPNGTKITTKVSNITFGLNKDYEEITNGYTGVLVDAEQNEPAYAYYVPNGDNHDVYILADDIIYAPTDCSNLCNGMSNLVSFNTSNLDFSRTTSMYRMLRDCGKLATIDVSDWNTANVTNMRDLFRGCKSVTALDVSGWQTGKVETMVATFQDCVLVEELDLNSWDVSKVTDMTQMFNRCSKLKTLKIDQWNPKSLSNGTAMFQSCAALTELDLSDWDTSSLTTTYGMFNHCEALTKLNVSTWNMSKVTTAQSMFQGCKSLSELNLSTWNTSSLVNAKAMFMNCHKLTALNVRSWNVSNVTNFEAMFSDCYILEYIHGLNNWNTSNGTTFHAFVNRCRTLKELDLSGLDTGNATNMLYFFDEVYSLQKLTLGEKFSCDANGKLGAATAAVIPAPAAVEGGDGKWYNADTGVGYLPADLPEGAATYVAAVPSATP